MKATEEARNSQPMEGTGPGIKKSNFRILPLNPYPTSLPLPLPCFFPPPPPPPLPQTRQSCAFKPTGYRGPSLARKAPRGPKLGCKPDHPELVPLSRLPKGHPTYQPTCPGTILLQHEVKWCFLVCSRNSFFTPLQGSCMSRCTYRPIYAGAGSPGTSTGWPSCPPPPLPSPALLALGQPRPPYHSFDPTPNVMKLSTIGPKLLFAPHEAFELVPKPNLHSTYAL